VRCKRLSGTYDVAAISNDIRSTAGRGVSDLRRRAVVHTAIRQDASINLTSWHRWARFRELELELIEGVMDDDDPAGSSHRVAPVRASQFKGDARTAKAGRPAAGFQVLRGVLAS
jgi:hypothetical protein